MATRRRSAPRGMTLVEIVIATTILLSVFLILAMTMRSQSDATAEITNRANTFHPAKNALHRILLELQSAVRQPPQLAATPTYAVSATSITFRKPVRCMSTGDPNFAAASAAGLVSANRVLYDPYAVTISYDAANRWVTLVRTGTVPAGMPTLETLATNVNSFAFYDGESLSNPPAAPTVNSFMIGVRLEIQTRSELVTEAGATRSSNLGLVMFSGKIRLGLETLTNSPGKPQVLPP